MVKAVNSSDCHNIVCKHSKLYQAGDIIMIPGPESKACIQAPQLLSQKAIFYRGSLLSCWKLIKD